MKLKSIMKLNEAITMTTNEKPIPISPELWIKGIWGNPGIRYRINEIM